MNQVILRGRLTADPEIRYTKDGDSVAGFSLAVPDRMMKKDKDGNFPADFIRCVAFSKEAQVIESFAIKGTELLVTGKLKSGSYERDGVKFFTTECQLIHFEFISGTKSKEENQQDQNTKK